MNLKSIDKLDDKVHEDRWSVKRPNFGVDGYTETTSITNLNRVLEIYESCGGVLLI